MSAPRRRPARDRRARHRRPAILFPRSAAARRYVTIDTADVQFNMQSDDRLTLVTATFPLRGALASGSRAVMREEPPVPVAVAALSSLDDSEEDDTSA